VAVEFRLLGPVEARVDGREVTLGQRHRMALALLLLDLGRVVPTARLIDALWGEEPPESAVNLIQGYVSHLRKMLGRVVVETRDPGYLIRASPDALDLDRFERLMGEAARSFEESRAEDAAAVLADALGLWRGEPLADVAEHGPLLAAARRLGELRLVALEQRAEAELLCGRHREVIAELGVVVADHPLRERPTYLLMVALYRCGRQADALEVYRGTRARLVDELGLEPAEALQELERAILRHDPSLRAPDVRRAAEPSESRRLLVTALDLRALASLGDLAETLAREHSHEVVLATTVPDAASLPGASAQLRRCRDELAAAGTAARAAAFTSLTPGADLGRMAREQDAELLLVDAPEGLLEDARLLGLLEEAPCDVAVLIGTGPSAGSVLVPFGGTEHDWAAVELGAWLARTRGASLSLAGSTAPGGERDASRLLASASLAVQRALGVDADPVLVDPSPAALVAAARDAGVVVVGLSDRWRRDGIGRTRTALAASPHQPTILVRRGLRPGGLAPRYAGTRFTWSIAG
jgi:DNA-binding SARP family transcriptional activator